MLHLLWALPLVARGDYRSTFAAVHLVLLPNFGQVLLCIAESLEFIEELSFVEYFLF
jgi:hypothetical protein